MYNTLVRRGTTIAFVIGFIVSLFIIVSTVTGVGPDIKADDFEALGQVSAFSTAVGLAILFAVIALVAIILGGAWGLITNPKSAMKFIIGIVLLLIFVGIAYAMSKEETSGVLASLNEQYDIRGTITKMISAGILVTVILLVGGVAAMILGEIRNLFK